MPAARSTSDPVRRAEQCLRSIAQLVAGQELEIGNAATYNGEQWVAAALADGRRGHLPGGTASSASSLPDWPIVPTCVLGRPLPRRLLKGYARGTLLQDNREHEHRERSMGRRPFCRWQRGFLPRAPAWRSVQGQSGAWRRRSATCSSAGCGVGAARRSPSTPMPPPRARHLRCRLGRDHLRRLPIAEGLMQ